MELKLRFNEDVLNYDKYRPNYVPQLFEEIVQYTHLNETKKVLEIGIGTGQATRPFLETNCTLIAIEMGDKLAEYSKEKFIDFPNFNIINTEFEKFKSADNEFDLIYSATAFHWIPEEMGYPKVFNLLKRGGTLALFWNHPFVYRGDTRLHVEIRKAYQKHRPSNKNPVEFNADQCQVIIDKMSKYGFTDISNKLFYQTRILNAEQYIHLLNTYSDHRAMTKEAKEKLEEEIRQAINKFGGELKIYDTMDLYLARKP